MTGIGTIVVNVTPDASAVADVLEIIAKHAAACAAELREATVEQEAQA